MTEPADAAIFDEAAKVYVQYLPVVQEMEQMFGQAVDKFLSAVHQATSARSAPLQVAVVPLRKYRCWGLAQTKNAKLDNIPYIWFEHRKPEIVIPGQLEVTVDLDGDAKKQRPQVEKALWQLRLPPYCQRQEKALWRHVATYVISYGKSARPIEDVAEALGLILKTIEPFKLD